MDPIIVCRAQFPYATRCFSCCDIIKAETLFWMTSKNTKYCDPCKDTANVSSAQWDAADAYNRAMSVVGKRR